MKNSTKRVTQITRNKSKSPKKCSHNIGKQEKKNRKIETEETNRKQMEEHIATITLNVNGVNILPEEQRLAEVVLKNKTNYDSRVCCSKEIHFEFSNIHGLKVSINFPPKAGVY